MPRGIDIIGRVAPFLLTWSSIACVPPARQTGAAALTSNTGEAEGSKREGEDPPGKAPPAPPTSHSAPKTSPPVQQRLLQGPDLCASDRPDLSSVLVQIDLDSDISPEELLLLKTWVQGSVDHEMGTGKINWQTETCAEAFLCAAVPPNDAPEFLRILSISLSRPNVALLMSARTSAISLAQKLDHDSVDWRLNTSIAALRRNTPRLQRSLVAWASATPGEVRDAALEKVLGEITGGAKLGSQRADANASFGQLRGETQGLRVTIAGPMDPRRALDIFDSSWKRSSAVPATKASNHFEVNSTARPLIHLRQNADEWSYALLGWLPSQDRQQSRMAIHLLGKRLRRKASPLVLITDTGYQNFGTPVGLKLEGPHEGVLETLETAEEEYERLISLAGTPSASELRDLYVDLTAAQAATLEPRCWVTESQQADGGKIAEVLRAAGSPLRVIWGKNRELEKDGSAE